MKRQKVVIAGGGFGGVKAALELAKIGKFDLTLISDYPDFRYYPTLFRTATGGKRMISSIPLSEIFVGKKIELVRGTVRSLDRLRKTVSTGNKKYSYDKLIIGLGVKTNFFGIKGLEEYSYGIKTVEDAEELKAHLHQQLVDDKQPDLNYVVVGGGPTGVELAGALPQYLNKIIKQHSVKDRKAHVCLVEAAPRLLPRMPKDISLAVARHLRKIGVKLYLNGCVQAETSEALMVNGKPIRSHSVVWTAGIANHPFFKEQGFQITANGKVRVDQFLRAEPDIYVIGDNADTPYSGLAQTALYDGDFVASNFIRGLMNLETEPYRAKKPIYVYPAGDRWAAVLWGKFRMYGRLGWALRRAADLVAYHDYEPWQLASKRWVAEDDEEDACPICANSD